MQNEELFDSDSLKFVLFTFHPIDYIKQLEIASDYSKMNKHWHLSFCSAVS